MSAPMETSGPHEISVPRTARYFVLGGGASPGEPELRPAEIWFLLHGYGQLADDFLTRFAALAAAGDGRRLLVAPEGLSRFYTRGSAGTVGASWMTRVARAREIEDTVRYLDAVHGRVLDGLDAGAVRVHVLGFSQGAAAACRWAVLGHARIDRVVAWAGGVPPDLDLARWDTDRTELVFVVGDRDRLVDERRVAEEVERLEDARLAHRLVRFEGGHELDEGVLARLAAEG